LGEPAVGSFQLRKKSLCRYLILIPTCLLLLLLGRLQGEVRPIVRLPAGGFKASFRPRNRPYRAGIKIP